MDDDNELPTLEELDEKDAQRRALSMEQTRAAVNRMMSIEDKLARLKSISDEEWEAAVEASKDQDSNAALAALKESRKRGNPATRRPEVIEMPCPLCGHGSVKRYPYQRDGWQYVCEGCKKAFDPELEKAP